MSESCYNPSQNDYYPEGGVHTDALLTGRSLQNDLEYVRM